MHAADDVEVLDGVAQLTDRDPLIADQAFLPFGARDGRLFAH
jgi:hypothetical protein